MGRPLLAATPRVRYLGRFLDRPGGQGALLGSIFGSPWGPKRAPKRSPKTTKKRSENRCKKRSHVRTVLRPTWGDLGPILVPSWGQGPIFSQKREKHSSSLYVLNNFFYRWLIRRNTIFFRECAPPLPVAGAVTRLTVDRAFAHSVQARVRTKNNFEVVFLFFLKIPSNDRYNSENCTLKN